MKTLLAGWFSFEQMGASAGDLLVRDLACEWLESRELPYDVALAAPFAGGVNWRNVDPSRYQRVVFVCGPCGNGPPLDEFLDRFRGKLLFGLNLTMLQPLDEWNPFEMLIERDSSAAARPDLAFLSSQPKAPVVGVIRIDAQPEYQQRDRRELADSLVDEVLDANSAAAVPIDTRLDRNQTGLRSAAEVEALISRMQMVITTRLHGMVLALKNGVPALAIDPVSSGQKIARQAAAIDWPLCFIADQCTPSQLQKAFFYCLTEDAREKAAACGKRAQSRLSGVRENFLDRLGGAHGLP